MEIPPLWFNVVPVPTGLATPKSRRCANGLRDEMTPQFEMARILRLIRQLYDDLGDAINAIDVDRIMTFYTDDLVAFDMAPALRYDREGYRKSWQMAASMSGQMTWKFEDLKIVAGDDVAFASALVHTTGTEPDGRPMDFWMRWSDGFKKVDGRWLIAHEHCSPPIRMEDGKALFDVKPDRGLI